MKTVQLQQQLKDLKDKAVTKHSKPLLYKASLVKEVQPSTSRPPNVRPEVVYCATNTDMCCMANFVSYLNNLQRVEMNSGALKIIPPADWTALHNFKGNSTMFDYLKPLAGLLKFCATCAHNLTPKASSHSCNSR